jgi:hypothetical protein
VTWREGNLHKVVEAFLFRLETDAAEGSLTMVVIQKTFVRLKKIISVSLVLRHAHHFYVSKLFVFSNPHSLRKPYNIIISMFEEIVIQVRIDIYFLSGVIYVGI